jgi:hypothetical protein
VVERIGYFGRDWVRKDFTQRSLRAAEIAGKIDRHQGINDDML